MSAIGGPLAVIAEFDSVTAEIDGRLVRWFGVAVKVKASGKISAREFGTLTDTDKNWLGRLAAADSLYVAHKVKGLTLTARDAVKVANVQSAKAIDDMVKAVRKGQDPLRTKAGTVKPSAGNSRKGSQPRQTAEVKATDYARLIGVIDANVHDATSGDQSLILAHALSIVATLTAEGVEPTDLQAAEADEAATEATEAA